MRHFTATFSLTKCVIANHLVIMEQLSMMQDTLISEFFCNTVENLNVITDDVIIWFK
jgi:hypothetical protein